MTGRARATTVLALAGAWALALAPLTWIGRDVAAFIVLLLAPGFLVERRLDDGLPVRVEAPARALAFSIAVIGALAAACTALGLSIHALVAAIAMLSFGLARAPARARTRAFEPAADAPERRASARQPKRPAPQRIAGESIAAAPPSPLVSSVALTCLVGLTLAAAVLAALDVNLSRDRMWYGAYVTHLADGGALDWREPMLATGNVAWRFAYNAWIVALAAWSSVADVAAVTLLERVAPPLLMLMLPASAFALARALVGDHRRATILALCSTVVLLASAYPYFSPDRYAFFARIVEDKTAALVLLCPVALSIGIDALEATRPRVRDVLRLVLALFATALTHAIVFFVAASSLAVYAVARLATRGATPRSVALVLAMCAVVAIVPAALGLHARSTILAVEGDGGAEDAVAARTDPVVRAHLRMERLRELPAGGPIVEPRLLADPLLVAALLGLLPALAARRSAFGAFTCASTLAFLALAFVPFLAPLFGRVVVPWMAYRALWGVPFGLLLGALVLALDDAARRSRSMLGSVFAAAAVLALGALSTTQLPWSRALTADTAKRTTVRAETGALLEALAALPKDALVAVAPGLAELVPAYTGRPVLAFSDRGTVALAGSRDLAESRLTANAAIVGLHGADPELRRGLMTRYAVTHVVYANRACDAGMAAVHESERFVICAVPQPATPAQTAAAELERSSAKRSATAAESNAPAIASLHDGIVCEPAPERTEELFRWQRRERWSAAFAATTCRVRFPGPRDVGAIRVRGHLPHAREALVFDATAYSPEGVCTRHVGTIEMSGDAAGTIACGCANASEVAIRLVPSFLPYLNLRELEIVAGER